MDELERLRVENRLVRDLLKNHGIASPGVSPLKRLSLPTEFVQVGSPEHKVRLFRPLFRGREDIYAMRWQSAAGKSGYSPGLREGLEGLVCRTAGRQEAGRQADAPVPAAKR